MSTTEPAALSADPDRPVTVLLIDDQAIVGEAVRRMVAGEADVRFHFCSDPTKAIELANTLAPTVILQDLVMPELDGLTLVKFLRANPATRDTPLIVLSTKEEPVVKAQAFAVGANDYLVKLPDRLELLARIRYHSRGYVALLERNEAYRRLAESQALLAREVAQAARYVESLLPEPIADGPVRVAWRFVPSMQLGGDSFGYHWLEDHFVVYLLDVSGHGVGPALLSVSARNVLASRSLPDTDFRDPGRVLQALTAAFPMEKHNQMYFTIWYGVYSPSTRQLAYAGAGHPAALLLSGAAGEVRRLESGGPMIGLLEEFPFQTKKVEVPAGARLLVYSDGVFEIERPDGTMWQLDEFVSWMAAQPTGPESAGDRLLAHARQMRGQDVLADDFSLVEVTF
jgi:sigma-B regulation protein RsbU (phosphoserine phosphatase)